MTHKKIEDMDYYEILDIPRSASQQEINHAYQVCKQAYSRSSLAIHSLIEEREREFTLTRVEEAFSVLRNTRKRKNYDRNVLHIVTPDEEDSYFRSSTGKLLIEDGDERKGFFQKLADFFKRK